MGNKRKQDQRRDDSSSSDAKRCRSCHCQNGETSRPSDGKPQESLRDAVIELKDIIQASTEEKFKRKIEKLKEKMKSLRKKDEKHKEDIRILKEYIRILEEDLRTLKEGVEELKSKIQEMPKEGCAEANHYDASPSQRSQLSQSTRFRLVIENRVKSTIYKKETVETDDDGGHIKVVMYDGGNPVASDHPLASVRVDLVVIEGSFNESKRDSWSKEEFEKSIIKPRKGTTRVVKNGTFELIGGSCVHEGATIMDNSRREDVKLGVMIAVHTEERVLEGVSNPFKVQEAKTKKTATNKNCQKASHPVPVRNLVQPTSIHATQHGQGLVNLGEQHCSPPPVVQDLSQKADRGEHTEFWTDDTAEDNRRSHRQPTLQLLPPPDEGNGQALNGSGQKSSQQVSMQTSRQPTSADAMQYGQGHGLRLQNSFQAAGNSQWLKPPLPPNELVYSDTWSTCLGDLPLWGWPGVSL